MGNDSQCRQSVPAGNYYDKYNTRNPIAKFLFSGFTSAAFALLDDAVRLCEAPASTSSRCRPLVHEMGCGEGNLAALISERYHTPVVASDSDKDIIAEAREKHPDLPIRFETKSIYDCSPGQDDADIIVCCEVLEHVADPSRALAAIDRLNPCFILFSVPREPLWRVMNMARGKYVRQLGNTPGHINHWGQKSFLHLLGRHFDIISTRYPLPWSMALCRPIKAKTF